MQKTQMMRIGGILLAFTVLTCSAFGASGGPQIQIIDHKVSIQADAIPLARLLHLLDQATGMTSKAPPELANRNISVHFSGLAFDDAVKKIFEGQPFDYVLLGGQGIVVTSLSQAILPETAAPSAAVAAADAKAASPNTNPAPAANSQTAMPGNRNTPGTSENPGRTGAPVPGVANGANLIVNQPSAVQTPFGLLPNTSARTAATSSASAAQQAASNGQLSVPIPTMNSNPAPGTVGTRAP